MAWRIAGSVVRGEIDNTSRDLVAGRIWLQGRDAPLELELKGNCLRDLAGCRVTFYNPDPKPSAVSSLATRQQGWCGDLTVSRKCKIPTIPIEKITDWKKPIPFRWGNVFYLEWFSELNGRVVVEAVDFRCEISLPAWQMTADEEISQRRKNIQAMNEFMERLQQRLDKQKRADKKKGDAPGGDAGPPTLPA